MKRFSADYIYTIDGPPIANGIVVTDDNGKILAITDENVTADPSIERYKGVITPGFINAHCHLELSHLHQKIEKHTGLIPFVKNVIFNRNATEDVILEAMQKADKEMWDNGIVAVGDISNQSISADIKETSRIRYHTFIEMIGIDPTKVNTIFEEALAMAEKFLTPTSLTVHAPYSLSKALLKKLHKYSKGKNNKISLHSQESEEEAFLYKFKTGPFMDFYKELNIDASSLTPQSKNTLQAIVPFLPKKQQILLVHNTYTSLKDIYFTKRFELQLNWCFCPKANLYIENSLPTFDFFKQTHFPITIGTDSLASNDELNILSEIKVLQNNSTSLHLSDFLKWATINGAKFLGLEKDLGTIEVGKTPGLNLLEHLEFGQICDETTVRKLI